MPSINSSVSTSQRYIPLFPASNLGRAPGLAMLFADVAALAAAVAEERLNIGDTSALWKAGQAMTTMDEAKFGVWRVWSEGLQHARTAVLRQGYTIVLGTDTSVVLFGAGAPITGAGSNGDAYLNTSNGDVYQKTAGAWALVGTIAIRAALRVPADIPYAATVTVNSDITDSVAIAAMTGPMVLNMSGTPSNHQVVCIEVKQDAVGGRVCTLGAMFALPSSVASVPFDTTGGRSTLLMCKYLASKAKWAVVSALPGF